MTEIDEYIAELAACLRVNARDRTRILGEVRDHLADAACHRERSAETPADAVGRALEAFGPADTLATELNAQSGARAMRRAPVIALAAGVVVFAGLVVAGKSQTHPAVPMQARLATQVSFFAAVLAFQVAVVAGACAASRALAVWQTCTAQGADRAFVRPCATISVILLAVAAVGWAFTLALSLDRLRDPNRLGAIVGGACMLCGAAAAIVAITRLQTNPADASTGAVPESNRLFQIGERFIGIVQRHSALACGGIAALSVWPAMAHAETTFAGALPWGIIQAATVVLAFLVLGPALGLRRPHPV